MAKRSRTSSGAAQIAVLNLGPPGLDAGEACVRASAILQGKAAFVLADAAPARRDADLDSLRVVRDPGIVGAARLVEDERKRVRGSLASGGDDTRSLIEARSLQRALWRSTADRPAVALLPLLMVTWHPYGLRYHARTLLAGYPTLISLPGLVEAPARPKGYYILKSRGAGEEELGSSFRGSFLRHGDDLTPYLASYVAAAGAFYLLGTPFCDFPGCALYDNHWQKELLEAPTRAVCGRHERSLQALTSSR